jgi:hypothetical protein
VKVYSTSFGKAYNCFIAVESIDGRHNNLDSGKNGQGFMGGLVLYTFGLFILVVLWFDFLYQNCVIKAIE